MKHHPLSNQPPRYSIVVPTYSRLDKLAECLKGISRIDFPEELFEVIVVDDGSPDYPDELGVQIAPKLPNLKLLKQSHGGPAKARNFGAKKAMGEFLVFLDDDCVPRADLLKSLDASKYLKQKSGITGTRENGAADNPFSVATQLINDYAYAYHNTDKSNATYMTTTIAAFPRVAFLKLGGFDTSYSFAAEDIEFCNRWLRSGLSLSYDEDVVVYHYQDLNFLSFCAKHFSYGRGLFKFKKKSFNSYRAASKHPLTFYFGLLSYPFRSSGIFRAKFIVFFLLIISQAVTLLGAVYEGIFSGG